ncbi:MAG: hypothetical protein M3N91_10995 [Pseudomonadota bacterium]|nr:hypothetical protein [Pseudomonadota bacterium]
MKISTLFGGLPTSVRVLLLTLVPAAFLVGLYGRFKGIGTWPLGVDEFYISRAIDRVLATGLPRFPCGGYYTRGILFQYVVAALRSGGLSPEFSGRFVAAVSSLAVLPPAFMLGKRLHGSLTGWLTVIILCVSIWEVEMARFGRMYAPFQTVFAWYLVAYLRFTIDKQAAALWWMIGLSVLGVMIWEGGTFLGIANVFAVIQARKDADRLAAIEWRRVGGLLFLLLLLYLATLDIRGFAAPALSDDGQSDDAPGKGELLWAWLAPLRLHPIWASVFLVPLGLAAASLRVVWSYRQRWMTFAGLCVILLACVAHTFTAAAGVLALMLLLRLMDRKDLLSPQGRLFAFTGLALLVFWLAFAQVSGARWNEPGTLATYPALAFPAIQALFGFPDILQRILWPWGRAMPFWSLALVLATACWFYDAVSAPIKVSTPTHALLGLLLLLILAVGAIATNRIETRYTFFLYPLLVAFAVSAILSIPRWLKLRRPVPNLLLAAAPLVCFGCAEDFRVHQLMHIDSAATNFRVGMSAARADHYYPRNDMRGVAQWLTANVRTGDLVVSGIPNLDQYYPGFGFFYLDEEDERYDAYVCPDGRTERWTNHAVLYKVEALKAATDSSRRVFAVLYRDVETRLARSAQPQSLSLVKEYVSADGYTDILLVTPAGESGSQKRN